MSSREDDELEELAVDPERSDERTMFDADMMARLNALDDDDEPEATDEVAAVEPGEELEDIGALVEPLRDNPDIRQRVDPFEETDGSGIAPDTDFDDDDALDDEDFGDDDATREQPEAGDDGKTVANFNLADFEALRDAEDDEEELLAEHTEESDESSIGNTTRPGYGDDRPVSAGSAADLWSDNSNTDESSLGTADRRSGDPVEATAAMVLTPLPETGEVNLAEMGNLDEPSIEDNTDRNTVPEVYSLVSTADLPTIDLGERALTVGRASSCDVHIQDATMSRQHCNVWMRDGQVWIEDLGSGNGTWVDGERISEPTPLQPGQTVQLGQTVEFVLTAPDVEPAARETSHEALTLMAPAVSEPLLGTDVQMSATYAHGDLNSWRGRLRGMIPLAAASVVFIVGASVFFVRQGRAQSRQQQYNQATALFVDGIDAMRAGDFEKASKTFDQAGRIDPKHPRLPLYRKETNALRMQAALLDEAERKIAEGKLQEATASLISLRPKPQLEARSRTISARLDSARLADQLAALEKAIQEGEKEKAQQLLGELRAAGLDTSKLELFEAKLGASPDDGGSKPAPRSNDGDSSAARRAARGPLRRVHQALRQGNVEQAFTINRELAASGIAAAAKLEDSGNLAELRELVRMAKEAVAVRDHNKVLNHTKRGLRLLKKISRGASGTRRMLQRSRAEGYFFQAQAHASGDRLCDVYRSLMQVKKLDPRHPKLKGAVAKVEGAAAQSLAWARNTIASGDRASAASTLRQVMCMTSPKSSVHREAKALLR